MLIDIVFFIFASLLNIVSTIAGAFGNLVPTAAQTSLTYIFGTLSNLNDIFPISTVVAILFASIALATPLFIWRGGWWLYSKIPIIGK